MEIDEQETKFNFKWLEKPDDASINDRQLRAERRLQLLDFQVNLSQRDKYREICSIGTEDFWSRTSKDTHIKYIVELYIGNELKGFAFIKPGFKCEHTNYQQPRMNCSYNNNQYWYIHLICTSNDGIRGKGAALLKEIEKKAREKNQCYIVLFAVPYVIMFYYKLGFRFTMDVSCTEDNDLITAANQLRSVMKAHNFQNPDDALSDPNFVKFLILLANKGFGEGQQRILLEPPNEINIKDYVEDGVYMQICLCSNSTQESSTRMRYWSDALPLYPGDFSLMDLDHTRSLTGMDLDQNQNQNQTNTLSPYDFDDN